MPCPEFNQGAVRRIAIGLFVLLAALSSRGNLSVQTPAANPPPPQDPLISLMMAQPKIENGGPVQAIVSLDPPVTTAGVASDYRVTFNALEESISWPANKPAAPGVTFEPGAHGQIFQPNNGTLQPRTTFIFHARAAAPGVVTVPEFTVEVEGKTVTVPAAKIDVSGGAPGASAPTRLRLELTDTNLYIGQAAGARVRWRGPPGGGIQPLTQVQLNGPGGLVDMGTIRQRIEGANEHGAPYLTYIYETTFIPLSPGRIEVFAQGFCPGSRIAENGELPGGPSMHALLESEPLEVVARPLPVEGRLPGFSGGIGIFKVEPPQLSTNRLRAGEPVELSVTVNGEGNVSRLVPPPAPVSADWQIFVGSVEAGPLDPFGARVEFSPSSRYLSGGPRGSTTFHYTLIPLTETTHATPPIPFAAFDPIKGTYTDITIPSVQVAVAPGADPAALAVVRQANSKSRDGEKELTLSGLATVPGYSVGSLVPLQEVRWFPLAQAAPALAFVLLIYWDRRRRYLEQHPEIVIRRRARHALRVQLKTLRRAAQAGDAPGFSAATVQALRTVCAPQLAAEPRALVGADVLAQLPEPERQGRAGELIRHIFAVTDASRFATGKTDCRELLVLQPETEQLLLRLEARL